MKKYIKSGRIQGGLEDVNKICACRKILTVDYNYDDCDSGYNFEYASENQLEDELEKEIAEEN